jgi:hypothetical protein
MAIGHGISVFILLLIFKLVSCLEKTFKILGMEN